MDGTNGQKVLEALVADKLIADQAALPGGAPTTPAPAPPGPPKIDRIDQLETESIFQKLLVLKGQVDVVDAQRATLSAQKVAIESQKNLIDLQNVTLEGQKKDLGMQMLVLQDEMKKQREALSAKYGIPMDQGTQIKSDGTLVPRPLQRTAAVLPHMVQGKLLDGTPISVPAGAIAPDNTPVKV